MQYTLHLKQKQIEQTKLEAEARKESTLQNAEAAAQAKIIDSKAELERQRNLSDAEANRIRVTAAADGMGHKPIPSRRFAALPHRELQRGCRSPD